MPVSKGQRYTKDRDKVLLSARARAQRNPAPTVVSVVERYGDVLRPGDVFLFSDLLGVLMCLCGHLLTIGAPDGDQSKSQFSSRSARYAVLHRAPLTIVPAIRCPRGCHYYITKGAISLCQP